MADRSPITPAAPDHQWVDKDHGIPEFTRSVDTNRLAEIITTVADRLAPVLAEIPDSLHERVDTWCLSHGYNDATTSARRRLVARQAVLNRLLKATVYEWHHRRGELPEFPANMWEIIQSVAEVGANPGFGECVLDYFLLHVDESEVEVIDENRDRLLASTQPAEDIGRLYEAVIPKEYRQSLSQFRTPPDIGQLMRLWAGESNNTVVDPGMGAGVLSSPFHPDWRLSTDSARVIGIDQSQLALLMGSTALTLYGQPHELLETDFFNIPSSDLQQDLDGIVCNPPYTEGDALPDWYKERVNTQLEKTTGLEISARSPLYTYFIYQARSFLSSGDRAAFLTPDSFMATNYGESLKQFLLDEFSITALVQFNPEGDSVFEDAQVTALISFIEATNTDKANDITRFIRVDESVEPSTLRDAVQNGDHGETDWGFINRVQQAELSPENNWTARFVPYDIDTSGLTTLSKFVSVHRGKSTGDVDFFCLSQDDVDEYEIPDQHLSRLIRRPKLTQGYDFCEDDWDKLRETGEEAWLLDPDELPSVPDSVLAFGRQIENEVVSVPSDEPDKQANTVAYLRSAITERDLIGTNALETRPYWYRPRRQPSPRVLVQDAGRDGFAFVLNETTARNIHNFRGFYDVRIGETELKALLAYLNSTIGQQVIKTQTQTQQGGYEKLSISALKSLPVIDPTTLEKRTVTALADLFDELRETARKDGDCDSVLDRLDSLLQQVM